MFKSIKIYTGMGIDLERFCLTLIDFGYRRQNEVFEEGDFARRGGVIDIFPFTFEFPVRVDTAPSKPQEFNNNPDTIVSIKAFSLATKELLWGYPMVIILPMPKAEHTKITSFNEELPLESTVDIVPGDYIVHIHHGIGRFLGLQRLKKRDAWVDHLVIEYDQQEKLFVPLDQIHLVQKYITFQIRRPKLNRLGSRQWQWTKERAKRGIQKFAWELLSLQAMRESIEGFAFSKDNQWQIEFEKTFPYQETPDQLTALKQVKQDMESPRPMDRLLCGDVGYGKTEVAMRAAFKATQDFKQVAFLVPTTILAEQHYHNFVQRLKNFPIRVEMLSRFRTSAEQKKIVEEIAQGRVDIVIGTHRLLSEDIRFKDLGLVIIDEEQRFGVKAKEKLKKLRLNTDVLTLTATPIPRTLYMGLVGLKDISVINTPPQNRLPVKTVVVEYNEDIIHEAVLRELKRNGQVYFLHNRIQDIEQVKQRLSAILPPTTRIAIGHGRLNPKLLERVMRDFLDGKIDVLVCTMIIESGIDIPNVNTLLVNNAHEFGLSDLHQLRGRVGRFNRPAYAYFILPRSEALDTEAQKRLTALQEYAHLGAGFKIAMQDMQLRGAGNLLGVQQHGFIMAVGFDLYCRLLREAVLSLRKAFSHVPKAK